MAKGMEISTLQHYHKCDREISLVTQLSHLITSNILKINRTEVNQREILYQISLLKFWISNIITKLWA